MSDTPAPVKEITKTMQAVIPIEEDMASTLKSIDSRLKKLVSLNLHISFVRGMIQGLGFILGTTVLLAILIIILRQFITVPVIGQFVSDILNVVEKK